MRNPNLARSSKSNMIYDSKNAQMTQVLEQLTILQRKAKEKVV